MTFGRNWVTNANVSPDISGTESNAKKRLMVVTDSVRGVQKWVQTVSIWKKNQDSNVYALRASKEIRRKNHAPKNQKLLCLLLQLIPKRVVERLIVFIIENILLYQIQPLYSNFIIQILLKNYSDIYRNFSQKFAISILIEIKTF